MMAQPKFLVMVDHDHVGRVLAERHRCGKGHVYDVLQKARERNRLRGMTLFERVLEAPANEARLRKEQAS